MASLLELIRRTLTPASLRNVLYGTDLQLWLLSAGLSRVGLSRRAARRCRFRTYTTGHLDLVADMLGQLRRSSGQLKILAVFRGQGVGPAVAAQTTLYSLLAACVSALLLARIILCRRPRHAQEQQTVWWPLWWL